MNLFPLLLVGFFALPLLEIYLLIVVGGLIGALPTVFMVVFTAVLGALLLRHQGFTTLQRVRAMLERGELPAVEVIEGVLLVVGGALLLTPGFFTDFVGFLCLIPPLRRRAALWYLDRHVVYRVGPGHDPRRGPRTIEGEFRREDDRRRR
ncbi:MAG TPA: FxsA family protein [Gammaproteobacteria bacterium]|nr:FxsA family protein [Gammaproteobacteria bacterium]